MHPYKKVRYTLGAERSKSLPPIPRSFEIEIPDKFKRTISNRPFFQSTVKTNNGKIIIFGNDAILNKVSRIYGVITSSL